MSENIFLPLALAVAFGLAALHIKLLKKRNDLLTKELRASASEAKQNPQQSQPEWHTMLCGTRLELGATGYWIELVGKKGQQSFKAYDPEGDCIGEGQSLPKIKKALEEQASYRAEFKPSKPSNYLRMSDER